MLRWHSSRTARQNKTEMYQFKKRDSSHLRTYWTHTHYLPRKMLLRIIAWMKGLSEQQAPHPGSCCQTQELINLCTGNEQAANIERTRNTGLILQNIRLKSREGDVKIWSVWESLRETVRIYWHFRLRLLTSRPNIAPWLGRQPLKGCTLQIMQTKIKFLAPPRRDLFIHTLLSSVPFETAEILLAKALKMSSQI